MRWLIGLGCFVLVAGCSLLDRQKEPQILDVRTDQEAFSSVGRGSKVRITLFTDDPDNDELDFLWVASGGVFEQSSRDSLADLFQDSVTVVWKAPGQPGLYDLLVEVSDGKSGVKAESILQVLVTQGPPIADAGASRVLVYSDTLRVALDGTGSVDPERDALRYIWRQVGGPGVNFDTGNNMPVFQAFAPADYIFVLEVRDDVADTTGAFTSDPDTVVVRVDDRAGRGP